MKYLEHVDIYHGSLSEIKEPDILPSEKTMDFGTGFYCTSSPEQALKWTKNKMTGFSKNIGFVNHYTINRKVLDKLKVKVFENADETWVDFVEENRNRIDHEYDIVYGPVADDDVNRQMNRYEKGEIGKQELIKRLKTYILVDQYLFHSKDSLKCLTFVSSKKIIKQAKTLPQKKKRNNGPKL